MVDAAAYAVDNTAPAPYRGLPNLPGGNHGCCLRNQNHRFIEEKLGRRRARGPEARATSLRGITGFEVISQKAKVIDGKIGEYRVTMEVTFVLE